jgi:hypothetical protein
VSGIWSGWIQADVGTTQALEGVRRRLVGAPMSAAVAVIHEGGEVVKGHRLVREDGGRPGAGGAVRPATDETESPDDQ